MKETRSMVLKTDTEAVSPYSEEDNTLENVPKKPAPDQTVCKDTSLSHSIFLAAVLTTAIALFSAGMVFSGKYDMKGLDLDLPEAIESFLWRKEKMDVKVSIADQEARSLTEASASKRANEARALNGELGEEYREEERPADKKSKEVLNEENPEENARGPVNERSLPGSIPTLHVTVQKGDTIHGILKRQFGESSDLLINAVRELNPEIVDMNRIRVGQRIPIPLDLEAAREIDRINKSRELSSGKRMETSIVDPAKDAHGHDAAD